MKSCIGGGEELLLLLLLRCVVLWPPGGGGGCLSLVPSQVQGRAAVLLEVQGRVGPPLAAVALMLLLEEGFIISQITNLNT